jgi:hypothetical protein
MTENQPLTGVWLNGGVEKFGDSVSHPDGRPWMSAPECALNCQPLVNCK